MSAESGKLKREVVILYFDLSNKSTKSHICNDCGKSFRQDLSKGLHNLYKHIIRKHNNEYQVKFNESLSPALKEESYYSHLDLIFGSNLPLSIVESPYYRKYVNIPYCISIKGVIKLISLLSNQVRLFLTNELPNKFDLKYGIWSDDNKIHNICIIACYKYNEQIKTPLLEFYQLILDKSIVLNADEYEYIFIQILKKYNKSMDNINSVQLDEYTVNMKLCQNANVKNDFDNLHPIISDRIFLMYNRDMWDKDVVKTIYQDIRNYENSEVEE